MEEINVHPAIPRRRACGTQNDSRRVMRDLNDITMMQRRLGTIVDNGEPIVIQMVFHICYADPNKEEIERDVAWTIDMLNKDYNGVSDNINIYNNVYSKSPVYQSRYNEYRSRLGDANIKFSLAKIEYNPVKAQTSSNLAVLDRNVKGVSPAVTPECRLNIWIADFDNGLLGFAQFPWEFDEDTKDYDGVLVSKGTFGQNASFSEFNMNKTLTHEIGHWLGLYHTFQQTFNYGGGNFGASAAEKIGDCVADTPPQESATYGNPFSSPFVWPNGEAMFFNFMDYVDDKAMFMFTRDQSLKIREMIHMYRPGLLAPTSL